MAISKAYTVNHPVNLVSTNNFRYWQWFVAPPVLVPNDPSNSSVPTLMGKIGLGRSIQGHWIMKIGGNRLMESKMNGGFSLLLPPGVVSSQTGRTLNSESCLLVSYPAYPILLNILMKF